MKRISKNGFHGRAFSQTYSPRSDSGYFKRRLEDLKDQNTITKDDPLNRLSEIKEQNSLVDNEEGLKDLYRQLPQKTFRKDFGKELHYVTTGTSMNRQAKDIALSRAWKGQEHLEDATLRMLVDSTGKSKSGVSIYGKNLAFIDPNEARKDSQPLTASRKLKKKLEDAQDNLQKYRLDKEKEIDEREQSEFRALYTEKFTPIGSFEKIRSIADQRVEESRRKGGFDSLEELRGKPLALPRLNQHIDRTEYYLNNMLARQKIVPPWIEAQSRVNRETNELRREMLRNFESELVTFLEEYKAITPGHDFNKTCYFLKGKFGSVETFIMEKHTAWKLSYMPILSMKITTLNNSLRAYNLQAPLPQQKLYLQSEKEASRVLNAIDLQSLVNKKMEERSKKENINTMLNTKNIFSLGRFFPNWK
ncbi:hypothetical protein HG535_0B00880 [Zygotorulaspora mrakii]|uniref:DnaJ homologue subfamily C member 28 conserved domain-containing protein n=1 Tax=Zygotorulaspora mrakii TaxID=42260 RepID=A0A7H9AXA6_ZYGMR|nr:uncharacterized protein HG535_0B00880 [Zygotorulaspora mrakii]QLG71050.1 hypothetical protein HG535_0B00880 [Zygotorulaspora mrakii]